MWLRSARWMQEFRAAASELIRANLYGPQIFDTIQMNAGAQPCNSTFFFRCQIDFWAFCVARVTHFYVLATAGLQCAEARENSIATIRLPVLLEWTAFWARTILSKFDFLQTSLITRKCFPHAFLATFFSVNRHFTKKTWNTWFLKTNLSVASRNGKVIGERCVELCSSFQKLIFSIMNEYYSRSFQGKPLQQELLSGSDFNEDWKQVGTKGTLRNYTTRYLLCSLRHLQAKSCDWLMFGRETTLTLGLWQEQGSATCWSSWFLTQPMSESSLSLAYPLEENAFVVVTLPRILISPCTHQPDSRSSFI